MNLAVHFKVVTVIVSIAAAVGLTGCATQSKTDPRVHALEMKLKKQHAKMQDLQDRNMVLEKRVKSEKNELTNDAVRELEVGESISIGAPPAELPASFTASTKGVKPVVTAASLQKKLPVKAAAAAAPKVPTPVAVSSEKTGEHFLYSKILETYRSKNSAELERTAALLTKSYPDSIFADNALYLSGLLAFENQDYKKAVVQFDRLLKEYPRSNKAVAAIFARASVEKRMGRMSDAKRGYIQVRDLYPGSPEAARVSVELKLLESASVKHRES